MDTSNHQKQYIQSRRKQNEYFFSLPWHRRITSRIERLNKRITFSLLGKYLRIKPLTRKLAVDEIRSILILRTDAIGDMVVTTPLWRILKSRNPALTIGVAGSFRNLDLLRADSDISFLYDLSGKDKALHEKELERVRKVNYDVVVACTFSQRTRSAILARKASKSGYTITLSEGSDQPHHKIFSKIVFLDESTKQLQMIEKLQLVIESVFDISIADHERRPSLKIDSGVLRNIQSKTDSICTRSQTQRYIVINTESATDFREWGYTNCLHLANAIIERYPDVAVLMICSPHQASNLLAFLSENKPSNKIHYFSTESLQELAALIRGSALVVSPDTSVVHFASAESKPVVGLYVKKNDWLPYKVPSYVYIPRQNDPVSTIRCEDVTVGALDLLNSESATLKNSTQYIFDNDSHEYKTF